MTPAIDSRCFPGDAANREVFAHAAAAGFAAMNLAVPPFGLEAAATAAAGLAQAAAEAGVAVSALTLETDPAACLAAISADARRAARRRVVAALDAARELKAAAVLLEAVPPTDRPRPSECQDEVIHLALEGLLELRFEAQQRAIRLACSVGRGGFLRSPAEARDFFDRINSPWVGAWLDVHAAAALNWPADWIRTLGWRLTGVTVDGPAADQRPGEASIDWPLVAAALKDARYDGAVTCRAGGDPAAAQPWLAGLLGTAP